MHTVGDICFVLKERSVRKEDKGPEAYLCQLHYSVNVRNRGALHAGNYTLTSRHRQLNQRMSVAFYKRKAAVASIAVCSSLSHSLLSLSLLLL